MKTTFRFIIILIITVCLHSCRHCDATIPTDPLIVKWFLKPGSYFVYSDSLDHISDSQYVYLSVYKSRGYLVAFRDGCSTYFDTYDMNQVSYRNGTLYDTIYSQATGPFTVSMSDFKGYIMVSPYYTFYTVDDSIHYQNFSVGGHVFQTVYKTSPLQVVAGSDTVSTDLYYAPGYGIVKRVEHRPTGDVSWDLVRYHIVQ
jgi:hypothetical protein